jgi:hypothetical protein
MKIGCPLITCAVKKKMLNFCWECNESNTCKKWASHRDASKVQDSFKCYQTLNADIAFILTSGVEEFDKQQNDRAKILKTMLDDFNDGRSKSYYCIASTVLPINELHQAIRLAKEQSMTMPLKEKAAVLHSILEQIAKENHYLLKLRR